MYAHFHFTAIALVLFDFSHIVGDVVNLVDVVIFDLASQHVFKTATNVMGEHLPVGKGVISGSLHRRQIILSFRAAKGSADQLPVGQFDAVLVPLQKSINKIIGRVRQTSGLMTWFILTFGRIAG